MQFGDLMILAEVALEILHKDARHVDGNTVMSTALHKKRGEGQRKVNRLLKRIAAFNHSPSDVNSSARTVLANITNLENRPQSSSRTERKRKRKRVYLPVSKPASGLVNLKPTHSWQKSYAKSSGLQPEGKEDFLVQPSFETKAMS